MDAFALNPVNEEPFTLPDEAASLRADINHEIAAIRQKQADLDEKRRQLEGVKAADFSPAMVGAARKLAEASFELLRKELAVRVLLRDRWYPLRQKLRAEAWDASLQRVAEIKDGIVNALEKTGYARAEIPDLFPCCHPRMVAAMEVEQQLSRMRNETDDARINREAIQAAEAELETQRARLLRL